MKKLWAYALIGIMLLSCSPKAAEPMPDYIYGQFIEHLGRCIYGGIWAEMLEDRKFYFAPNSRESFWKVMPEASLQIETQNSFVGDLTPVLIARNNQETKLIQDGIGTRKNMTYTGRIVIKAQNIRMVNISLQWGEGKADRDMVSIMNPENDYTTYALKFDAVEESENASLMIEAIGNGKLWVGTLSLMPDDNVQGFRAVYCSKCRPGQYRGSAATGGVLQWRCGYPNGTVENGKRTKRPMESQVVVNWKRNVWWMATRTYVDREICQQTQ